jgi:hypothetical protein
MKTKNSKKQQFWRFQLPRMQVKKSFKSQIFTIHFQGVTKTWKHNQRFVHHIAFIAKLGLIF